MATGNFQNPLWRKSFAKGSDVAAAAGGDGFCLYSLLLTWMLMCGMEGTAVPVAQSHGGQHGHIQSSIAPSPPNTLNANNQGEKNTKKNYKVGGGEHWRVSWWLRVLGALVKDLGSVPSTQLVTHNHL